MIESGKAPAQLIHSVLSRVQQHLEERHAIKHLAYNRNLIVSLSKEPLHFGVDQCAHLELFCAEIHAGLAFLDCDSEYIFSERLVNPCP